MSEDEIPNIVINRRECNSDGWCVHYAGFFDRLKERTHCEAGVQYEAVKTPVKFTISYDQEKHRYPSDQAHPCFKREHHLTKGCDKCRFPTPEEIAAKHAEYDRHHARTMQARAAIIAHIKDERGVSGNLPCPVCNQGTLHFSRARCNGHVRARCTTEKCVAWIE